MRAALFMLPIVFLSACRESDQKDAASTAKSEGAAKKEAAPKKESAPKSQAEKKEEVREKFSKLFGGEDGGGGSLFGVVGDGMAADSKGDGDGGSILGGGGGGGLSGTLSNVIGSADGGMEGVAGQGIGGLGIRGTGSGGGGTGSGEAIGIGGIGTKGKGGGTVSGYGSGPGRLGGKGNVDISIDSAQPVVMGSLDKEIIRRVIQQNRNQVRYCYESQLARDPGLAGRVAMKFVITGEGTVGSTAIADSTVRDPALESCLVGRVRTWRFPKPKGGGIVIVNYPFVFRAAGGGEGESPEAPAETSAGAKPAAPPPPPPAPPPPAKNVAVQRFPTVAAPDAVAAGVAFAVEVSLTEYQETPEVAVKSGAATADGALALDMPAPQLRVVKPATETEAEVVEEVPWKIDVSLNAPGMEIVGGKNLAQIELRRAGDSTMAMFQLKAKARPAAADLPLFVTYWHEGRFLAKVARTVKVGAAGTGYDDVARAAPAPALAPARAPDPAPEMHTTQGQPTTMDSRAPAADLTLWVLEGADPARPAERQVLVQSPFLQPRVAYETVPAGFDAWLRARYETFAGRTPRGFTSVHASEPAAAAPSKDDNVDLLRGFGRELYAQFAPAAFRDAARSLRAARKEKFASIQIFTNSPAFPWELLILPAEAGLPESDFLGIAFRVARWHVSASPRILDRPASEIGVRSLFMVAPNYGGGEALPSQEREVAALKKLAASRYALVGGTRAEVAALLGAKKGLPRGVIHFAGHGIAPLPGSGADYVIRLSDAELSLLTWKGMVGAWADAHPLVFLNACEVGQAHRAAGFVDGWAPAVLEAGASGYIGGLWPLGDTAAAAFAERFYAEGLGAGVPVADALRTARRGFYDTGDPTYLAYVFYGDTGLKLTSAAP